MNLPRIIRDTRARIRRAKAEADRKRFLRAIGATEHATALSEARRGHKRTRAYQSAIRERVHQELAKEIGR